MRIRTMLRAVTGVVLLGGLVLPASLLPTADAVPSPTCSWYGETDQRDVNVGAPDLDAHYWLDPLPVDSGGRVTVTGTYPAARYFSFHLYDESGTAIGSIYDQQIDPAHGSANPFRGPVGHSTRRHYTLHVRFEQAPARPERNTLYFPPTNSPSDQVALLVYRIYVPTNASSPQGGVPFPQVTINSSGGGPAVTLGACSTTPPPFGSALWSAAAETNYPDGAPVPDVAGATRIPTWARQFGSALGNQQNAYLATTISRQYGDLVVIHGKAPSFPNNRKGTPPYHRSQLRYWSFCTYDVNGQAGYGCGADYAAVIRHGHYTYVVSDPGVRPANATAKHGVTWLPWGGTQSSGQIVLRNMLPSAGFRHAAEDIRRPAANRHVARIMGAYYPRAVYCKPAIFARGGWRACFRAGGLALS